ncbi:RNA polymerase sigma-70 factor (ECF subfamily) [Stella humosa]|uniref:RNA polymerase sigma-70 factor (ECF subfamily) n=1 Tax=Stella humosa TaxID=94 RepID=A0A3N1KTB9_9PROT|nr:sigma-70 family RNA polymerase sigma factor [Stella humosa]ROP83234.1 RNA polymerase sigma-70 factor (ECF subfamily) [Stella humosa]BBK29985.1 RNA polymerase sigma factor [Stella humosa]
MMRTDPSQTATPTQTPVRVATAATDGTQGPSVTAFRGDFRKGLLLCLPQLRAFARVLTGARDRADDLVQDALTRALAAEHRFEQGTNIRAWLMTILRNQWISDLRSARRHRSEELTPDLATLPAAQLPTVALAELGRAMEKLSASHREVLMLVAASGLDHEEAAQICGCAVGTIKSRLNRARNHLHELLEGPAEARADDGETPVRTRRPAAVAEVELHAG